MSYRILLAFLILVGCTDGTMGPPTSSICTYTCEYRARCRGVGTVDTEHIQVTADLAGAFEQQQYSHGWVAACTAMCSSENRQAGSDASPDDGCFDDGCTMECTTSTSGSGQ